MAKDRRLMASVILARDASKKIVNAARAHDEKNLPEAMYKLMFSIAESTSVIAGLLIEAMMEEE